MIEDLWYKNAIIYSLDLGTFMDANGDGAGDLEGLTRRLDYLQTLGVDVIWLAPFQPSPNHDNGYDVSDYYGVDPRHGSSGDFVEFVHQTKRRGIRVIMDLVVNHTSDRHPWFQVARKDPTSRYRDWYVWSKKRPKGWNTGMVFPGVQDRTWTRDDVAKAYYFHRFFKHQPDLNLENPEVRTEIHRIIGYWIQLGVAGFRLDAVPFMLESVDPEIPNEQWTRRYEYLEEMRTFLQWRMGDAIFLGEANVRPGEAEPYFANGRGIQMMFNFWVNQHLFLALATERVDVLARAIDETKDIPATSQWAHFLRNHDELDLGRLSERDRQTVFAAFGPEPRMQLYNRGIRRRLGPMLGTRARNELAYSLLFSLPGAPVIRYGDEIGMGENLSLKGRDAVRTPMQWSDEPNGGFSSARKLVHPVITAGPWGYHDVSVESQRRDANSMLQWMGKMIRLRKECLEIGWGDLTVVDSGSPHVLVLHYSWRGSEVLTAHNLSGSPREAVFSLKGSCGGPLLELMAREESQPDASGRYHVKLEAYGYRWYRVGTLNYALRRTSEQPVEPVH